MTNTNQPVQTAAPVKGIEVTPKAIEHIRLAMAKEGIAAGEGGLRLGVQGGGCSGMSYLIRFDSSRVSGTGSSSSATCAFSSIRSRLCICTA